MSKTYKYSELPDEIKEKLREELRSSDYYPHDGWHEGVYDLAKEEGAKFGLWIDKIHWTGFWSQGDGASFEGRLRFTPATEELYEGVQPIYDELLKHHLFARLQTDDPAPPIYTYCSIHQAGMYYHEGTMRFDWEFDDQEEQASEYLWSVEDELTEALRDYARWIYKLLKKDYDYYMSDEAVDQELEAQDLIYDEHGEEV